MIRKVTKLIILITEKVNPFNIVIIEDYRYHLFGFVISEPICSNCGYEESLWEFSLLIFGKNDNKSEKNQIMKNHFLKIKNQLLEMKI